MSDDAALQILQRAWCDTRRFDMEVMVENVVLDGRWDIAGKWMLKNCKDNGATLKRFSLFTGELSAAAARSSKAVRPYHMYMLQTPLEGVGEPRTRVRLKFLEASLWVQAGTSKEHVRISLVARRTGGVLRGDTVVGVAQLDAGSLSEGDEVYLPLHCGSEEVGTMKLLIGQMRLCSDSAASCCDVSSCLSMMRFVRWHKRWHEQGCPVHDIRSAAQAICVVADLRKSSVCDVPSGNQRDQLNAWLVEVEDRLLCNIIEGVGIFPRFTFDNMDEYEELISKLTARREHVKPVVLEVLLEKMIQDSVQASNVDLISKVRSFLGVLEFRPKLTSVSANWLLECYSDQKRLKWTEEGVKIMFHILNLYDMSQDFKGPFSDLAERLVRAKVPKVEDLQVLMPTAVDTASTGGCFISVASALMRPVAAEKAEISDSVVKQLVQAREAAEALEVRDELKRDISAAGRMCASSAIARAAAKRGTVADGEMAKLAVEEFCKGREQLQQVFLRDVARIPIDWTIRWTNDWRVRDFDRSIMPLFQALFTATRSATRTRDRRSGDVPQDFCVHKVQTVENGEVWWRYRQHQRRMLQKSKGKRCGWPSGSDPCLTAAHTSWLPELEDGINESYLFHGCSSESANSIAKECFNLSHAGRHGAMYGRGAYFAESVTKADEYTGSGAEHCLLVCRVLLGNVKYVEDITPQGLALEASCSERGSHDSVLGDRQRCVGTYREFVTFNTDAIYPAYIVWYSRK